MQIKKLNHFCIVLEIYLICISMQNMWRVPDLILTKKIPINQNFIFFLQTFRWCCNWQTVQKNGNSRNLIQHQQQSSPVQFPIGFPWGVSTNLRLWKLESLETWDFGEKPRLWKTENLKKLIATLLQLICINALKYSRTIWACWRKKLNKFNLLYSKCSQFYEKYAQNYWEHC